MPAISGAHVSDTNAAYAAAERLGFLVLMTDQERFAARAADTCGVARVCFAAIARNNPDIAEAAARPATAERIHSRIVAILTDASPVDHVVALSGLRGAINDAIASGAAPPRLGGVGWPPTGLPLPGRGTA
jgi:hypothetical protein